MRARIGEELLKLFDDVGRVQATLQELYDAAEARFGSQLDRRPDPDRPSQEKWKHDLRWEIETAVADQRIIRRKDLGRGMYEVPSLDTSVSPRRNAWDGIFTVPINQDIAQWMTFNEIYAPGPGRPRDLEPGAHLWLRYQGRLVWRSEVVDLVRHDIRHSSMDGTDHGPGWSILLGTGESADLTDADIGFTGKRWGQGLRYLDPMTQRVRGGAGPKRSPQPKIRFADTERISPDKVVAYTAAAVHRWNRVEARLVEDWIAWCADQGRSVRRPLIPTDEGTTIKGDAFDERTRLLVEAKGSASREHIRMAIGQVLDYSSLMTEEPHTSAVLLPSAPPPSLERLLHDLGIGLIFRDRVTGFVERLIS